jgi:hypothetical protein
MRAAALAITAWCAAAMYIDGPAQRWLAGSLAAAVVLATIAAPRIRGGALLVGLLWLDLVGCWLGQRPRNDRDWTPAMARLPRARIEGDVLTIENVRDFGYRTETDVDERWETRSYDLSRLVGIDVLVSSWGMPHIAHTWVSWELADQPFLSISIETRRERSETYDPIRGLFRQFELYYVVADERDVIALRTSHRHETVRLYRLSTPPDVARALLDSYVAEMQRLEREPEWYNAVTHNCSTTTRLHAAAIGVHHTLDWRVLANAHLDELLYEHGLVDTSMPLDTLREASDITARAAAIPDREPDFSRRIREGLPPRPR